MAKFQKGVTPEGAIPISEDIAKEYQRRSVEKRKENKAVAEMLREALMEDAGGGLTKGEFLVRKALLNHQQGKLTFRDLKDMAAVLGEATINVKSDTPGLLVVPEGTIDALEKWKAKK